MTAINHEITIKAPVARVFKALTTLNDLKSWHGSHMSGEATLNGVLTSKVKDKPTFQWKIIACKPEQNVAWECIEGPGDSVGTQAIFNLSPTKDGRVLVEFSHTQWPGEHGNYRKCNTLWGVLLHHLKHYVETGVVAPALD